MENLFSTMYIKIPLFVKNWLHFRQNGAFGKIKSNRFFQAFQNSWKCSEINFFFSKSLLQGYKRSILISWSCIIQSNTHFVFVVSYKGLSFLPIPVLVMIEFSLSLYSFGKYLLSVCIFFENVYRVCSKAGIKTLTFKGFFY